MAFTLRNEAVAQSWHKTLAGGHKTGFGKGWNLLSNQANASKVPTLTVGAFLAASPAAAVNDNDD